MSFYNNKTIAAMEAGTKAFYAGSPRVAPAQNEVLVEYWLQGWDYGADQVELDRQADYHIQQNAFA